MAVRQIYLCRIYNSEKSKWGKPFFVCDQHFEEIKESLKNNNFVGYVKKMAEVKNEYCDRCPYEPTKKQRKKSMDRAIEIMNKIEHEAS